MAASWCKGSKKSAQIDTETLVAAAMGRRRLNRDMPSRLQLQRRWSGEQVDRFSICRTWSDFEGLHRQTSLPVGTCTRATVEGSSLDVVSTSRETAVAALNRIQEVMMCSLTAARPSRPRPVRFSRHRWMSQLSPRPQPSRRPAPLTASLGFYLNLMKVQPQRQLLIELADRLRRMSAQRPA